MSLAIRLTTTARSVHVETQVQDFSFRKAVPGGYLSSSLRLDRPLALTPPELAAFGRLVVSDTRNGDTVWEGRIEDLGRGADASGQLWDVNAVGPMAHATDVTVPLIYQDTDLSGWSPANAPVWLDTNQISPDIYGEGLQIHVPKGTVVPVGDWQVYLYRPMGDVGMKVAKASVHYGEDTTDGNWAWYLQPTSGSFGVNHTFTAGSNAVATLTNVASGSGGGPYIRLLLERFPTGVTVPDDNTTVSWTNILVRSTLFTAAGVESRFASTYSSPLKASAVVADLLGRLLPQFDGANATIDTTSDYSFADGNLAYPGGVTPAQVLTDLMTLLPSYYWTAGKANKTNGKWSFAWTPWPTTIRYVADAQDGFSSPSSASGVYDQVTVRYLSPAGNPMAVTRTSSNPILNAAGLHRSAQIDLGSTISGKSAAQQAGDQFLFQNAVPSSSGTLVVARPIYDRLLQHSVMPWEIEPGYLVRVRDVAPASASDSDRDGTSTFRVVAVTYDQSSGAATLELDKPARTLARYVGGLPDRTARIR